MLAVQVWFLDEKSVRVKIVDRRYARFEVPIEINEPTTVTTHEQKSYNVDILPSPFSIKITRKSDNVVVFDTWVGPLQYYDQFLQVNFINAQYQSYRKNRKISLILEFRYFSCFTPCNPIPFFSVAIYPFITFWLECVATTLKSHVKRSSGYAF